MRKLSLRDEITSFTSHSLNLNQNSLTPKARFPGFPGKRGYTGSIFSPPPHHFFSQHPLFCSAPASFLRLWITGRVLHPTLHGQRRQLPGEHASAGARSPSSPRLLGGHSCLVSPSSFFDSFPLWLIFNRSIPQGSRLRPICQTRYFCLSNLLHFHDFKQHWWLHGLHFQRDNVL